MGAEYLGPTKDSDGSMVVTSEVIDVSTSTRRIEKNDIQYVDSVRCIHSYPPRVVGVIAWPPTPLETIAKSLVRQGKGNSCS